MDDNIITIGDANGFGGWRWKMTIDLKELAESAGVRKQLKNPQGGHYDEKVLSVPTARAKKLLKLIRQFNYREEDLEKVDFWMAKNPKLALYPSGRRGHEGRRCIRKGDHAQQGDHEHRRADHTEREPVAEGLPVCGGIWGRCQEAGPGDDRWLNTTPIRRRS